MAAMGLMAGMSLMQGWQQSEAAMAQGQYQKQQGEMNSKFAELAASDAIKRGDEDAQNLKKSGKKLIGAQRASFAAQGIDVNDGSAMEIQQDTASLIEKDAFKIKTNAWREAWGYKVQATNAYYGGQMAMRSAQFSANSSMLAGGLNAVNYGYKGYKAMREK